ncbi:MAG: phosphoribosylglycinamide formyltransferase [Acidimicrobiia bacterium]|nr:phosphoribosylglycinamide formyltransferase [Acidimicrobiia bacterium]
MNVNLAVLVSGDGTNLQALIDASHAPDFGARIGLVVSDRRDAFGLERARTAGISTEVIEWSSDRDASTLCLLELIRTHDVDALVLAGFMRILGASAIDRFPNRIINVHPSLLPEFPGRDAIGMALAAEAEATGVTVHFVDEQVDHGPILAQERVPILPGDTRDSLAARIHAVEHELLPRVVSDFANGRLRRRQQVVS